METLEKVHLIASALDNRKGLDIRAMEVGKLTTLTEYFVLASGASISQTHALADEVDMLLSKAGEPPRRIEGYSGGSWILIDFGDVLVHIFHQKQREFYAMERLWADGVPVQLTVSPDSGQNA